MTSPNSAANSPGLWQRVIGIFPGLAMLLGYERSWIRFDLLAGVSVAAIAVPTGIAYAQLFGYPAEVGLYSSILPLVAYALLGSSRQLIVGPDAATIALVAATVAPLAGGDAARFASLSALLALLVGAFSIVAGIARLGFLADFLSRPILVGFLNGVALNIGVGQLGKLFGYSVPSGGFFRTAIHFAERLDLTHWPTLVTGVFVFIMLRLLKRRAPAVPAPLVGIVVGGVIAVAFRAEHLGMALVGPVKPGLPPIGLPVASLQDLAALALGAIGVTLVSFSSGVSDSRSFAIKNGYSVDANREFIGIGAGNIASGFSHGFAVTGTDSRTAIADSVGGKSQMTGVFAALTMAVALLFVTKPLAYIPVTALAAILMSSAVGLFNISALKRLYVAAPGEFVESIIATLGVITIGTVPGILIAVGLTILKLLASACRPNDAILGNVEGEDGLHDIRNGRGSPVMTGLLVYRFDSAVVFFNSDFFRERVRSALAEAGEGVTWLVLDAQPINLMDTTGADVLVELHKELSDRGITLLVASPKAQVRRILNRTGHAERVGRDRFFSSVKSAIEAVREGKLGSR